MWVIIAVTWKWLSSCVGWFFDVCGANSDLRVYAGIPHLVSSVLFFFQELISQMLQVNVEARCTAGEILSHPWVSVSTHILREGTSVRWVALSMLPHRGFCACRALHPSPMADGLAVFSHEPVACR